MIADIYGHDTQLVCLFQTVVQIPKSAEDVDLRNPNDMSYVFSGAYTPLLCRIIEQVCMHPCFFLVSCP